MNTPNTETNLTAAEKPGRKRAQGARAGKQARHVAPNKAKGGKKPTSPKSAAKKPPKAEKGKHAREGSKSAALLDLLRRKEGATLDELMKATGWQAHSVRGFLSGTVRKKMGLTLTSTQNDAKERSYSITA